MPTLKLSLERSEANKQNIILAGDFNCPNINSVAGNNKLQRDQIEKYNKN
jgi:endonuclease/exonuclease/phosphatase (EEP) superfamily protein YafD